MVVKGSGTASAAHWPTLVEVRSAARSSPAPSTSSSQAAASRGCRAAGVILLTHEVAGISWAVEWSCTALRPLLSCWPQQQLLAGWGGLSSAGWGPMCSGEVPLNLMVVAERCLHGWAAPVHEVTCCGGGSSLAVEQMCCKLSCFEQPSIA